MAKAPEAKYYFTYDMLEAFDFCEAGKRAYKRAFPEVALVNRRTVKAAYKKGFRHFRNLPLELYFKLAYNDDARLQEVAEQVDEGYVHIAAKFDYAKGKETLTDAEADKIVAVLNHVGDVIAELKAKGAL